jgi:hypothetical protein
MLDNHWDRSWTGSCWHSLVLRRTFCGGLRLEHLGGTGRTWAHCWTSRGTEMDRKLLLFFFGGVVLQRDQL